MDTSDLESFEGVQRGTAFEGVPEPNEASSVRRFCPTGLGSHACASAAANIASASRPSREAVGVNELTTVGWSIGFARSAAGAGAAATGIAPADVHWPITGASTIETGASIRLPTFELRPLRREPAALRSDLRRGASSCLMTTG